jgi:hypothetical protein
VFIDEARTLRFTMKPRHTNIVHLGTTGRHHGHTIFGMSQFVTGVDPSLRWNCAVCYCFRLANIDHANEVWEIYNRQSINGVPVRDMILRLQRFECIKLTAESAELCQVTPPSVRPSRG